MAKKAKKTGKRWVRCTNCGHVYQSGAPKPRCGKCHSYNIVAMVEQPLTDEIEEKENKETKEGYKIPIGVTRVELDIDDLSDAKAIIDAGRAKNVTDVIKKSIKFMLRGSLGGESMAEKKSPEERLTEYSMQEIAEAKAEKLRAEAKKIKTRPEISDTELDKLEQQMTKQMRLRMLEANLKRMEKGEASPLEQMMTMQMYKDMGYGGGGRPNEALIKALDSIEARFKKMEEDRKYDDLKKLVLDVVAKPRGASEAELLTKMAEIQGKRDENLEKVRGELAQARQEVLGAQLGSKIERLEQAMAGGKKLDIKEVKDVVESAKELSKIMGPSKEKSGADRALEVIDKTLSSQGGQKLMEQIGAGVGQAVASRKQQPQPPVQYVPAQVEQVPVQKIPEKKVSAKIVSTEKASSPEEEEYKDLVQISKQ